MKDKYNRPILSLRISITNRCNLNCIYCHHDGMVHSTKEMTPDEIYHICRIVKKMGVKRIRLSGGEPLVYKDLVEAIEKIKTLNFKDISMTTNGIFLKDNAQKLVDAGLNRVNVSLDTLSEVNYQKITGKNYLNEVKEGIIKSVEVGMNPVKINMVVMKNINENEIQEMFEFTKKHGVILQLIEIIESECCENNEFNEKYHFELDNLEKKLIKIADKFETRKDMQNRKKFFIDNGEIEIIHPIENTSFCKNCTRLRITPNGEIKPCLLRNDNLVNLIDPLRDGVDDEELFNILLKGINNREPYYKG